VKFRHLGHVDEIADSGSKEPSQAAAILFRVADARIFAGQELTGYNPVGVGSGLADSGCVTIITELFQKLSGHMLIR
jgi:hypothetical protein